MQLHSPGYFSQPKMPQSPQTDILTGQQRDSVLHCSTKSHDEARRTKFNCVHTPEPFTGQNLFINCPRPGPLGPFWSGGEMMLPEWRAVDADQDRVFSVTFCLCIFIYSFIHFASRNCCVLATRDKILSKCPCLPFCDEFLPLCPNRVGYSLLMLLLFSLNTQQQRHHSRLYWCLTTSFPNFSLSSWRT